MKKHPNLCRALLLLIGVFLAALPTQAKVYDFENESDNDHWHFINGTQTNKWVINTAAGSKDGGTKALYVSGGTSYSYSNTPSTVWAYCDNVFSGTITISFDWKGTDESSYDYMYAYLVPVSAFQPTAGSTTIPTGAIQIGSRFNGQSSWTTFTDEERTLTEQYQLYFMWHNDASVNGSPIAVDKVNIVNVKTLSYPSFEVVREDISQSTANVIVKYTRDTIYRRLGYIFKQDTIWNADATSDSIVFRAINLLPDSAYQLSFIAEDSVRVDSTSTEEYESYYYIYDLDVYRDTHNELYYTETDKFTTKPIQATVTLTSNPTQSIIPVSIHYDCGDISTIDRCGLTYYKSGDNIVDTLFFTNTNPSITLDTIITGLMPNTMYYVVPFVDIDGTYSYGSVGRLMTENINVDLQIEKITETRVSVHVDYNWGDALDKGTCGIQYCKGDTMATNAHIIPISSDSTNGNVTIEGLEPNTKYTFRVFGGYNDFERNETAETIFSCNYPFSNSSWIYYEEVDNTGWETEVAYYPITLIKGEEYIYEGSRNVDGSDFYGISDVAPKGTSISGNCKYAYRSNDKFSCCFSPQETGTYYLFVHIQTRPNKHSYVRDVSLRRTVSEKKVYSPCSMIKTLPITFANPELDVVGQTYAVINSTYDYGDATLVRNVLEFKQSADASAQADTTLSITDMQTKINNLLPNTIYYYRQVLETEEGGISVAQDERYTFESTEDNAHWHFINGTQTNTWTIGTAAGSYGGDSSALYISSSTSYSYYSYRGFPEDLLPIWAYCDEELSGVVTISFDWKAPGSYGYMYVYLVPVDASSPTAGSTTVPEGAIQIGSSFNGQSSWTTFTDTKRTLTQQYHLYFLYCGTSWDQKYFAIDNVNVKYDWQEFTTLPITLTTQFADGISNTSALLHGTIDCDRESYTEIGFEWKRSDAPATVKPQRLLVTDRVDENLLFRLEGLSSDRYYDFRTFCSYRGESYYGEWVGFLTSDKEVLIAPTVQTVGATVSEQGAEMEGFIVTGTEPILQKGFEVWIKDSTDVKTTVAEGSIIRAFIPEPWSYTTYQYKAYAKTASGTTYGETLEITTGYIPRDVQDVVVTPSSNSAEVTWTEVAVADYYILTLFADEAMTETLAVYRVSTDGSISRLRMHSAVKSLVTCSIEDLSPNTDYYFEVVAYNDTDRKVAEETGTFATEPDVTDIRPAQTSSSPAVRKILYNGHVLILRGDKVYTLTGQTLQ